jgi:hypothetical protein
MFEPQITLVPEPDGEFSLLGETPVPNASFSAGKAVKKAPSGVKLGAQVVPVRLALKFKTREELGAPRTIKHRAFNLKLSDGQIVRAFVTLDDRILGSTDVLIGADPGTGALQTVAFGGPPTMMARPPLTPAMCQAVVVASTPSPGSFTGPSQQRRFLGVIDDTRAQVHRAGIRDRMRDLGCTVKPGDVTSGPAVSVAQCRDSVFNNAH